MGKFLENYIKLHFKPDIEDNKQLTFKQFSESYTSNELYTYGIELDFKITTQNDYMQKTGNNIAVNATFTIKLNFEQVTKKTFLLIKFLDDHYDDILNAMRLVSSKEYKIDNDYTKNLEKVYGKYLS